MADSPSELQLEIEKLERKHAEHPEGRFFVPLANAYRKMGDVETAEALLRGGIERHPDYLSAHIVLGRCLADRGAVGEAEDEFRFVLTQDPQNLIALRTLGELAVADNRAGEAAEWYRELLAVDPMNEDARQALDSLADAPAPELETEFRSGAGWWESSAADPNADEPALQSSEPPFDTPSLEDLSLATDELADSTGEEATDSSGAAFDSLDGLVLDDEPAPSAEFETSDADDSYAWGGNDDLPGLRSEEPSAEAFGALAGADEPGGPMAGEGPEPEAEAGGASEPMAGEGPEPEAEAGGASEPMPGMDDRDRSPEEEPRPFISFAGAEVDDDDDAGSRFSDEGSSEVVTETIAELYARQGLHDRAAAVYSELIRRRGGDPVLEQRLAEIERLGRAEQAGADLEPPETGDALTFADEEALLSAPLDAEAQDDDDSFAATFADGFTTVYEDRPESSLDATEPHASFPDEAATESGGESGEEVDEHFDEHPLPELAPRPEEQEAEAALPAVPSGSSIANFLGGLAAWRPTSPAAAAPLGDEPEPFGDFSDASAGWETAVSPGDMGEAPAAEAWDERPVDGDYVADAGTTGTWEEPAAEPSAGAYAEPWDTTPFADEEASGDLPYLEEAVDSTASGGTGPAEDEPFPWELPGAAPATEPGEPDESSPRGVDPFFVDDVEPASMRADEPLPETAPGPEARPEPEPEVRSARVDQTEDEDLESFQAWLRSLKR